MAKILYVEDNEMNRDMLSRRLQRREHEILLAFDGKEGLEMMKSEKPDLVLMDMGLPIMDGFEFLENYMKEVNEAERAPVLVYSGKDLTEVQSEMLEKNVAGMIKKDEVSMDELSAIVTNIYNQ